MPTGGQGTQAWDRYAFVNNNPVRYNDPTGHRAQGDGTPPPPTPCPFSDPRCIAIPPVVVTPTATPGPVIVPATPPPPPPPPFPHLDINVSVDWSTVDYLDTAIDGATVVLDAVTIGALLLGHPEVALGSEVLGDIVGAVGVIKSGVDAYNSWQSTGIPDLSGLATAQAQYSLAQAERRIVGGVPVVGTIADVASLIIDLHPVITIQWSYQ